MRKGLEPIPQTNQPNHGFLRGASQANLGLRRTLEASQPKRQLHGMMRPRFLWMLMEMIRMYLWIYRGCCEVLVHTWIWKWIPLFHREQSRVFKRKVMVIEKPLDRVISLISFNNHLSVILLTLVMVIFHLYSS